MDGQFDRVPAVHPGMIPAARRSVENLPSGRGVVDGERGRVLARYARLMRSGRPEVCLPGRREIEDRERFGASATGSDGKVIYPDRTRPSAPPVSWRPSVGVRSGPTCAGGPAAGTTT